MVLLEIKKTLLQVLGLGVIPNLRYSSKCFAEIYRTQYGNTIWSFSSDNSDGGDEASLKKCLYILSLGTPIDLKSCWGYTFTDSVQFEKKDTKN